MKRLAEVRTTKKHEKALKKRLNYSCSKIENEQIKITIPNRIILTNKKNVRI